MSPLGCALGSTCVGRQRTTLSGPVWGAEESVSVTGMQQLQQQGIGGRWIPMAVEAMFRVGSQGWPLPLVATTAAGGGRLWESNSSIGLGYLQGSLS